MPRGHGTYNYALKQKCNCDLCKNAKELRKEQDRAYRKHRRNNLRIIEHGNFGYQLGCRCEACKAGKVAANLPARLKRYGLTSEQYQEIWLRQSGACAICQTPLTRSFHIDHNHDTMKVRGFLCGNCNIGIGNLQDSVTIVARALDYLSQAN